MKRLSFIDKTNELALYTQRYPSVTLFEITKLYGASFCSFSSFILSLPLLIFSYQIIALPLSFCIIALAILSFFDQDLWLPDSLKKQQIPSPPLKRVAIFVLSCLERVKSRMPESSIYEAYFPIFRSVTPVILAFTAFQVGFIQSPDTSYFSVFSLILLSLGSILEDGWLLLAGGVCFLLGLF